MYVYTFDQRFVVWFFHFQEYSGHFSSLTQTLEHGVHEASVPEVPQPHATSTLGKCLCNIGCLWCETHTDRPTAKTYLGHGV